MPSFPQTQSGILIEAGNYRATAAAVVTAAAGDVILTTPAGATTVNLPAATLGALVTVVVLAAFAVTVKTTDASTINGVAGATGLPYTGAVGVGAVVARFASDGSNWWTV